MSQIKNTIARDALRQLLQLHNIIIALSLQSSQLLPALVVFEMPSHLRPILTKFIIIIIGLRFTHAQMFNTLNFVFGKFKEI